MINIIELNDSKLELRSYDIAISAADSLVDVAGLTTDVEHEAVLGFFLFDESYTGLAATLDTKSKLSLKINEEEIVDSAHACIFFKNLNIALKDAIFKTNVPVKQSNIKLKYSENTGAQFSYPRTVTLYLVCKKRKQ